MESLGTELHANGNEPGLSLGECVRILVLNYEFPPVGGGGGRVAEDLCRVLARRGHSIRVQTAHVKGLPKVELRDGYTIFRSWSLRRQAHTCSVPEMAAFVLTNVAPSLQHVLRWKPDVIHVHFAVPTGALGWLVSKLTRVPYVLTTQLGDVPGGVPEQTDKLFKFLKPFTVPIWRHAAFVTAPSRHVRELAVSSYRVPVEIIPNGVDLSALQQSPSHAHDPKRIVFAGRFNPQKNLLFLVEILARVSDLPWHMDLLGDGPLMGQVRDAVFAAGIEQRVTFHGWVEPDVVDRVMGKSDILFLPSLSEGLPVVGARALGAGLAIVGSDVGGIDDVVRQGANGFLCPVNDFDAFEKALRRLLTSDGLLTTMKAQSRELAQELSLETICVGFEQILQAAAKLRERV